MRMLNLIPIVALLTCVSLSSHGEEPRPENKTVTVSLKNLKSDDANLRRLAAETLGERGAEAQLVLPALVEALADKESKVRSAARDALVKLAPASIPALGKALKDKRKSLRLEATIVLREIGSDGKAAVPALIAALKDESDEVRLRAAAALGDMGPAAKEAVPALIEATKDKSTGGSIMYLDLPLNVTQAAFHAVLKIDPRAADELARVAVPLLIERLDETSASPGWPAYCLAELGPRAKPALAALKKCYRQGDDFKRRKAAHALEAIGEEGWKAIGDVLSDPTLESAKRLEMLQALRYGRQPSTQVLPTLLRLLKDEDPRVRIAAMGALGSFGDKGRKAIPALIEAFADKEILRTSSVVREEIKFETVAAVVRIGPAATPALIEALQHKEPFVRWQAASALAGLGRKSRKALPALQRTLENKKEVMGVAFTSAAAIVRMGGDLEAAMKLLVAGLESPSPTARWLAADCVAQIGPRAKLAVPALRDMLEDKDPQLRRRAVRTLAALGPEAAPAVPALAQYLNKSGGEGLALLKELGPRAKEAVPALLEFLKDDNGYPWTVAMETLAAIGPAAKPAVPLLIAALKEKKFFNHEPIKALGGIGPAAADAVPALIPFLDDSSAFTRGETAKALGQIGLAAKLAVPRLEKLLTDEDKMVRVWAAFALANITAKDEPYVTLLRKAYNEKASRRSMNFYRADALRALAALQPRAKSALPELIAALGDDKTAVMLPVEAAHGLARLGGAAETAVPRLIEILTNPPSTSWRKDYQKAAAQALGAIGSAAKAAVPSLTQLRDEGDEKVSVAAAEALAKIEKP